MGKREIRELIESRFLFKIECKNNQEIIEENRQNYISNTKVFKNIFAEKYFLEKEVDGIKEVKINQKFFNNLVNFKIKDNFFSILLIKNKKYNKKIVLLESFNEMYFGSLIENEKILDFNAKKCLILYYSDEKNKNFFVEEILNKILSNIKENN